MKYLKIGIGLLLVAFLISGFVSAKSRLRVKALSVSGRAEYLTAGKTAWERLKKGQYLYTGDSVKTYINASVDLSFDGSRKNLVTVKPDTHVVLKLEDPERIELIDGEVFYLVKSLPRGSTFEIRTPTAVCGARGTGGGAKANKNETVVSGYEKDSYVKGLEKDGTPMKIAQIVKEGYKSIVKRFQRPSKLMKLSEREMKKWDGWKNRVAERVSAKRALSGKLAKDLDKIQSHKERIEERKDEERIEKRAEEKTEEYGRNYIITDG